MTDEKITLFLADDHKIVVEGIMALMGQDPCIHVVGHCNNGLEVLPKVQSAKPDVLVLDISLPGMNGLDLCRMVKARIPETAILILTMHSNEQCIVWALENGASGYMIKESVSAELCEAVHAVARGEVYLGRGIPRTILDKINRGAPDPYDMLTDREHMVLQLTAEGNSSTQIGEALQIPSNTVDGDRASLMKKLGLHNQADLVKFAIRRRMITVD